MPVPVNRNAHATAKTFQLSGFSTNWQTSRPVRRDCS
jgi:hypothetical protein